MSTGWTTEDLELVEDAIRCMVKGERITADTISGPAGDRVKQYANMSLDQLRALRDEIKASLQTANHRRIVRTRFDKGL